MIVQITFDNVSDELIAYAKEGGEEWEVLPGMLMLERNFQTIEDLSNFMYKCEEVYGGVLSFVMAPLPKDKDDESDSIMMTITDGKRRLN